MTVSPSQSDHIQHIKDAADIVQLIGEHVTLQKSGTNYKGLCPFHGEKTPSFMVNPARRSYHCFGCGEGGDVFSFMMSYHRLSFPEAVKTLAERYHILLPEKTLSPRDQARAEKRQQLYAVNERAAEVYRQHLESSQAEKASAYLRQRGISQSAAADFQLGYAPDSWDFLISALSREFSGKMLEEAGLAVPKKKGGWYDRFRDRLLFPIHEVTGKVVGFGGRLLGEGRPKYLNSPETPIYHKGRLLFGLYQNKDHIRRARQCLLVEGNFDLLSLAAHDIRHVAAPLGTALTPDQVRILKGYAEEVILLYDGDAAGLKASLRSIPLFLAEQLPARVALLPEGHDPDTYVRQHGPGALLKVVNQAPPLSEFIYRQLVEKYGLSLEGKTRIVADLQPLLATLEKQPQQRAVFLSHFSQMLGLTPEQFLGGSAAPRRSTSPPASAAKRLDLPLKQRQLLEFLIMNPEYLGGFLEAGLEEVLDSKAGMNILLQLRELAREGSPSPERLLERLQSSAERAFVSQLLMAPVPVEGVAQAVAAEMTAWLQSSSRKLQKERLLQQISEAQQVHNDALCLELMEKMREMDQSRL